MVKFDVEFHENSREFSVDFRQRCMSFEVQFANLSIVSQPVDVKYYTGLYEITPSAHNTQTFDTNNKLMLGDMTILKIPIFDVTNTTGGTTVYIASEV